MVDNPSDKLEANSDDNKAKGTCFHSAFKLLNEMDKDETPRELLLVHGNIPNLPQVTAVNHAWVEVEDTVYDCSDGKKLIKPKEEYYAKLRVGVTHKYTQVEAMGLIIKYGHYGPWDESQSSNNDGTS